MMLIQATQKIAEVSQNMKASKKPTKKEKRLYKYPNFRSIMGDLEGQPLIFWVRFDSENTKGLRS